MADLPVTDLSGRTLGEFTLQEVIDEGGFGSVYKCEQLGLHRSVVVKVLSHRMAERDETSLRFVREAQLASQVDHPYATQVYAFGIEDDGLLWIAMEHVHGVPLSRWLDQHGGTMSLDQFVPFFERVAEVVQTAHERGIIHRDLKPANIMVIERGGKLLPKLLDFGVAKLLEDIDPPREFAMGTQPRTMRLRLPSPDSYVSLTTNSTVVGTPHYIAPELWTAPATAGAPADLYALGVIAYEALTGRRPFRDDKIEKIADHHIRSPVPPVAPGLPQGLNGVFLRALAKRPENRYHDALELAAALRTEADALLVSQVRTSARQWVASGRTQALLWRDDMLERLEAWTRRTSRADASLTATDMEFIEASRETGEREAEARTQRKIRGRRAAIAAMVAMIGVVIGVVQYRAVMVARLARQRAETAEQVASATIVASEVEQGRAALLHDEYGEAQRHLGEAWRRGDRSAGTAFMYARALQPLRSEIARLPAVSGRMWSASWSPDGRQIVTTDDKAAQIWEADTHELLFSLNHGDTVYDAKYTNDGRRVVTACGDGAVRIWNTETGTLVREMRIPSKSPRWFILAANDRDAAAVDLRGDVAAAWDTDTGAVRTELQLDGMDWPSVGLSMDGRWLSAGGGNALQIVDTTVWHSVLAIPGPLIHTATWDPTGPRIVTGSATGDASMWDIPSGTRVNHLREVGDPIDAVAVSPNGRLVAVANRDGSEQIFSEGALASQGNYLRGKIYSIGFDLSSSLVMAAGSSGSISVAEVLAGIPLAILDGPSEIVRSARFDSASRRIVGASWDGTARIWDVGSPYRYWSAPGIADDCGLVGGAIPDGKIVAVACVDHPTRVWDTTNNELLAELPSVARPSDDFQAVFPVAAPGRAAVARGNAVEVYALPGGRPIRTIVHRAAVTAIAVGSDGSLISGAADGSLLFTRDGEEPKSLPPSPAGIDAVAILGDRVAVADRRGHVRFLDRDIAIADVALPARTRFLRPSPDGRVVVAVPGYLGNSASPMLLDPDRQEISTRLESPQAYSVRWVDGGRAILTAHSDGSARLWDADGALRRVYRGGPRYLGDADMDNSVIAAVGGDGLLRFWDIQSGRQLWSMPAHMSNLLGVYMDHGYIVTRGSDGSLSRWHLPDTERVIAGGSTSLMR